MGTHTPTPWVWATAGSRMSEYSQSHAIAQKGSQNLIAGVFSDVQGGVDIAQANAAFIVRACNAHDELLAQLEANQQFLNSIAELVDDSLREETSVGADWRKLTAANSTALAKARGE